MGRYLGRVGDRIEPHLKVLSRLGSVYLKLVRSQWRAKTQGYPHVFFDPHGEDSSRPWKLFVNGRVYSFLTAKDAESYLEKEILS